MVHIRRGRSYEKLRPPRQCEMQAQQQQPPLPLRESSVDSYDLVPLQCLYIYLDT